MPTSLAELGKMEGGLMAFEFGPYGQCEAHEKTTPDAAAMAAKFCATVTLQFNTLASAFSALSEQQWVPQRGWVYQSGKYTVVAGHGGYRVVFAETAKANHNDLVNALAAETQAQGLCLRRFGKLNSQPVRHKQENPA